MVAETQGQQGAKPFYEHMRGADPGDLVLSFQGAYIRAIGVAQFCCRRASKPTEFGSAGPAWGRVGWKVEKVFVTLTHQIPPTDHLNTLVQHLSVRHALLPRTLQCAALNSGYRINAQTTFQCLWSIFRKNDTDKGAN